MRISEKRRAVRAELALFVLWPNGQDQAPRVLRRILDRFHPVMIRSFHWSHQGARQRLSELYGRPPQTLFDKDREVGSGRCTAVMAVDHRPRFGWRRKAGLVNRALDRLKRRERRGGVNYLHASDTERDALAFASRLFSESADYWLGLKEIAVEASAGPPLKSLVDAFCVLNRRVRYAVLRNWQGLPDLMPAGHGDVDLLVDEPGPLLASFPTIWKKHPDPQRVHFHLRLAGRRGLSLRRRFVAIDVRRIGDGYYEENWQRGMLARRVLSPQGFFHLAPADHFYAVLYHALLHKPQMREDYRDTLRRLGRSIDGWSDDMLDDVVRGLRFLASRVPIQRPIDRSVYWNAGLLAAA
jgi:hypothetical protein